MADSADSKVDSYGFERPEDYDYTTYEEFMASYLSVLARRAAKWSLIVAQKNSFARSRKLKRYIRKGIPAEHRTVVWMEASGAEENMRAEPTLYDSLLDKYHQPKLVEEIEKDVPRTFPENIYFQNTPSDPNGKRKSLYNVLLALAEKNKEIGYCQGTNFIAGLLLLVVKDEHKVFWLMDTIVNKLLPAGYYSQDMIGTKVDQEVLGELVKLKVPEVGALFEEQGVTWPLISSKWFLCLYADILPVETVLRIWDAFFYEGSKVLFRVAVTMVKMSREELMRCNNFADIIGVGKKLPAAPSAVHCHEFMQSVFKEPGSFPQSTIDKLRAQCRERFQ